MGKNNGNPKLQLLQKILHEPPGIIEFIKQVEKKKLNLRLAEHLLLFCNKFYQFDNTGARM